MTDEIKSESEKAKNLYFNATIDPEDYLNQLSQIKTEVLQNVANNFKANINNVAGLLTLPAQMVKIGYITYAIRKSIEESKLTSKTEQEAFIKQYFKNHLGEENTRKILEIAFSEIQAHLEVEDKLTNDWQSFLYAALLQSWTAFESLANDMWVGVLNAYPGNLAQRALADKANKEQQAIEGLSQKQINIDMLARYGYDLRSVMGTLLKDKFDLTGVNGLKKAYLTVFVNRDNDLKAKITEILGDKDLYNLEQMRHVLTHRGGLVDENYISNVKSPLIVGEKIELDMEKVVFYLNTAIKSGIKLLVVIDGYLSQINDK
ncbi:MAG TPA: hypothetical protein VH186_16580 [Chloroflexia bacterium]|nr:hypothetical protein [Chloroflexia bacterium]